MIEQGEALHDKFDVEVLGVASLQAGVDNEAKEFLAAAGGAPLLRGRRYYPTGDKSFSGIVAYLREAKPSSLAATLSAKIAKRLVFVDDLGDEYDSWHNEVTTFLEASFIGGDIAEGFRSSTWLSVLTEDKAKTAQLFSIATKSGVHYLSGVCKAVPLYLPYAPDTHSPQKAEESHKWLKDVSADTAAGIIVVSLIAAVGVVWAALNGHV
jgi:hypothetical protein